MRSAAVTGSAAFGSIFAKLDRDGAAALGGLLDAIEACEAAAEGSAAAAAVAAAAGSAAPAPARAPALAPAPAILWPRKEHLPSSLRHSDVDPILFVCRQRELFFQSLLHRRVWAQVRGLYLR
jgi:hypothetical protein